MHDIVFDQPIPVMFKEDLERQVFYISERIADFDLIMSEGGIAGLRVDLDDHHSTLDEVANDVHAAAKTYLHRHPKLAAHFIWRNRGDRNYRARAFEELTFHGGAFQTSRGLVALGEKEMAVMDFIDRSITRIVKKCFAAREYRYPTLIPLAVLSRGGYLRSFPHLLMFAARLHSDHQAYHALMQQGGLDPELMRSLANVELCLPPTMCYHTYQQFADSTCYENPGYVVTAKGKSFRFESKYEKNLERLWDFTIREVVFLGTSAFVIESRKRLMRETFALMEQFGVAGSCATANDPFFIEDDEKNNAFAQTLMELKYELRLNVRPQETIACASFNLHNDFLGNAFNIRFPDGGVVRTGCAGFGLERLTFAFLAQYGLDEEHWPKAVREGLETEKN